MFCPTLRNTMNFKLNLKWRSEFLLTIHENRSYSARNHMSVLNSTGFFFLKCALLSIYGFLKTATVLFTDPVCKKNTQQQLYSRHCNLRFETKQQTEKSVYLNSWNYRRLSLGRAMCFTFCWIAFRIYKFILTLTTIQYHWHPLTSWNK